MLIKIILFFQFFISTASASSATSCTNETIPCFSDPSICYSFHATPKVYLDAEEFCLQIGGHLISIHSEFDNSYLAKNALQKFANNSSPDFWFGANAHFTTGSWSWMDKTMFNYDDWEKGQPQGEFGADCGAMNMQTGYWAADLCSKLKSFVCEIFAV